MRVTDDQLRTLRDIAQELDNLIAAAILIGPPPAWHLKQMDKLLPDLSLRIRTLATQIAAQPDEPEARF